MNCPDTEELYRYLLKHMSPEKTEDFRKHLEECKTCEKNLADFSQDINKIEFFLKNYEWNFEDDGPEDGSEDKEIADEGGEDYNPDFGDYTLKAVEKKVSFSRCSPAIIKHSINSVYLSLWKKLFFSPSYRLKLSFAMAAIVLVLFFPVYFIFSGSNTVLSYKYRLQSILSPENPVPYYNLGLLMREEDNITESRELIEKASLLNKNYSLSFYNFGDNYLPDLKRVVIFSDISSDENKMLYGFASVTGDRLASVKSLSPGAIETWKGVAGEKRLEEAVKSAEGLGGDYLLFLESLTWEENMYALTYSLINIFEKRILSESTVRASDLFGLQTKLVLEVAKNLTGNLTEMEERILYKRDFKNEEAFRFYLEGKTCYYRYTEEDNRRAIELFKKSIELEPEGALSYAALSDALTQEYGLFSHKEPALIEEAMGYSGKALELDPHLPEAYKSLGLAYIYQGKREEAIKEYKKALELNENYTEVWINLGMLYMNEKDFSSAVDMFGKAIDTGGDSPEAYKELAGCYLLKREFDRAIELYKKAIMTGFLNNHSVFQAYSNLALCYKIKGMYDKALIYFQDALEVKPDSGETCYKMAEIYNINGNGKEAMKYYRTYMELEPEGKYAVNASETLKLLEEGKGKIEGLIICSKAMDLSNIEVSFKNRAGKPFTSLTDKKGFYSLLLPEGHYSAGQIKREGEGLKYKKTGDVEIKTGQIEIFDIYLIL